jgi:2-methylisocitrate lyase-like PEP mutase family enzyme
MVEQAGFKAVYMTGYGASASVLGAPDLGLMTATEMASQAARLSAAVNLPLIADADTGFGNPLNVMRTVRLYEVAGASSIQIEDQPMPKKCGHMENKQVVATAEMVARIRAAISARTDRNFLIIARTDARAVHGLDEALRRGEEYLKAGADILFIEAPESDEEMVTICRTFRGVPLLANVVEAGKTPYHSTRELEEMGYSLAIFPISTLLASTRAISGALEEIRDKGRLVGTTPTVDFKTFNRMMGLEDFLRREAALSGGKLSEL